MRAALVLVLVGLAAAGCQPKNFAMEGKDAEQMTKDGSQCRSQVAAIAQRDRYIADQSRDVFAGERERYGQQDLYNTMASQSDKNNVARLTARCMEARGWTPKDQNGLSAWWTRNSTFNIGK